jgi:predicted Abi (CAAX) family protease
VYGLFLVCALPIGVSVGLLRPHVLHLGPAEAIAFGLLFVHPALVEELLFRALLLPREGSAWPRDRLLPVAAAALALYVAAHPINAWLFRPQVLGLFASPAYLALATLLGIACTMTYLISRSIWPPVAIHWLTVVLWIWLFDGRAVLRM